MFLLLSKQDQVRTDLQYVCRKLMKRILHHTAETSSIHWASACLKSSVRPLPISAKFSICWNCSKQDFYLCLENCCWNIITRILVIVIIIIEAYSCLPKSSLHGCIALFGVEKQEEERCQSGSKMPIWILAVHKLSTFTLVLWTVKLSLQLKGQEKYR